MSNEEANDCVAIPHQGGQDQVGVPQMPLLGHEEALKAQSWKK